MRTDELNEFGFKVVRFSNDQIINNWNEVEKYIADLFAQINKEGSCSPSLYY